MGVSVLRGRSTSASPRHRSLGRLAAACAVALPCFIALPALAQSPAPSGFIITIAGTGTAGFSGDGGRATDAELFTPKDIALAPDGSLFIADTANRRIRRIDPSGIITTVAGTGEEGETGNGGPATSAAFSDVVTLTLDAPRGLLYLADTSNSQIRRVNLTSGIIDGVARHPFPQGVAVDSVGAVYLAETPNHRIWRVAGGAEAIIAGNGQGDSTGDGGPATAASFLIPTRLALDAASNLYIAETGTNKVRRIDAASGIVTTVAGGGNAAPGTAKATETDIQALNDVTTGAPGELFIANWVQVFRVDLATGNLSVFAGTGVGDFGGDGGPATEARLNDPSGLAYAPGGGLYIADSINNRIRYVVPDSINLVGNATQTQLNLPWVGSLAGGLAISNNPNLTVINIPGLTSVAGNLTISENDGAEIIHLGALETVDGSLTIQDNGAEVINIGSLETVDGSLTIVENDTTETIDLGSLVTVDGSLTIEDNGAEVIHLGNLQTVDGSLTVVDNGSSTVVHIGDLVTVNGDLTVESSGSDSFATGSAAVSGNTSLSVAGHPMLSANTAAASTSLTMLNGAAKMEVLLPDGTFTADKVPFTVEKLAGNTTEASGDGSAAHLASYRFNFAAPTLNSPAELNFELRLSAMETSQRQALLALLHDDVELTLAVRGDAPGSPLQLFEVCAPAAGPIVDQCVTVLWLDGNGQVLDPSAGIDPAAIRFESLVGHFSTYSVIAAIPALPGDTDDNGAIDIADYFAIDSGRALRLTGWANGDFTIDGVINAADYMVIDRAFLSQGAARGAGAIAAAVPEPAAAALLLLATLLTSRRR